jgi:hypothetical protein
VVFFMYLMVWGERWFFIFLIMMELLTINFHNFMKKKRKVVASCVPSPQIYMYNLKIFQYTNEQGEIIAHNASLQSKLFQNCLKIYLSSVSGPSPPLFPKAIPDSESCLISICIFCSYSQVCFVILRSTSTADLCKAASSSLINLSCSSCLTWCKKDVILEFSFSFTSLY